MEIKLKQKRKDLETQKLRQQEGFNIEKVINAT